jgi:hypothetical protein
MTLRRRRGERDLLPGSEWVGVDGAAAGGSGRWGQGAGLVLLLAAILLLFAFFAARTAGFRELVADHWAQVLGVRPQIGASRLAWNGDLVLEGVAIVPPEGGPPLFQGPEIRLRWRPFRGGLWILIRPELRVDGRGSSLFPGLRGLNEVAAWPELEDRLSADLPSARWEVREGRMDAYASGLNVWRVERLSGAACRLDIPGRNAVYFTLFSASGTGLEQMPTHFPREWLWIEGRLIRLTDAEEETKEIRGHD